MQEVSETGNEIRKETGIIRETIRIHEIGYLFFHFGGLVPELGMSQKHEGK